MSLPALDDITAHRGTVEPIDGLIRVETSPREKATPIIMEMMRSVYPHDEVFGTYCTVNDYIVNMRIGLMNNAINRGFQFSRTIIHYRYHSDNRLAG